MSDVITPTRRARGKAKKPAMGHISIRLPVDVLEFYQRSHNFTRKMREILIAHAEQMRSNSEPK